jgi:hypothetical protein
MLPGIVVPPSNAGIRLLDESRRPFHPFLAFANCSRGVLPHSLKHSFAALVIQLIGVHFQPIG